MIPWTITHQAPLSTGFSRQEYWSGLPFPPPGDLPDPGIKPESPASPALAGGFFTSEPPGKINRIVGVSYECRQIRKLRASRFAWKKSYDTPRQGVIGEGNGNPLQYSCQENPRNGGAWWAAIYGVAQSRTQLRWCSSSSSILYWCFSFWLTSLCIIGSSFIYLIRTDSNVFFLMAE